MKFRDFWIASVPMEPRKACPRESEEPLSRPPFSRGHALRGRFAHEAIQFFAKLSFN